MGLLGDAMAFLEEPIPSFYFEVVVQERMNAGGIMNTVINLAKNAIMGSMGPGSDSNSFHTVNGLEISFATTEINEAGWSSPRPAFDKMVNGELELVRYLRPRHMGIMGMSLDPMSGWCKETMEAAKTWEKPVVTKDVLIYIYHPALKNPLPVGPSSFPLAGFIAQEAYPTFWGVSQLDSTNDSDPVKETIKLKYTEMQRIEVPPM